MPKTAKIFLAGKYPAKSAGLLVLLTTFIALCGCQGVSSGASSRSSSVAAGQLGVSPTTLSLGSVAAGASGMATGNLSAGSVGITVTAASSNNSAFSVGGLSLPLTISAGQSVPFTVTFSPQSAGAASATLTFTSDAQPSMTTENLTGAGTAAGSTHAVNLSWNASTSPNISGYNVYRASYSNACGSLSKINSVLNTSTLYTDSAVTDGASYCYATTAVNSSNEESVYSNIASPVQIPPQ
ncbi:MAG: hypothetical protein WB660_19130 [Candidatus Sulfotelmatobacter sp.]